MPKITYPTTSIWMDTEDRPEFGKLGEDLAVDVAVIGAGISGLTAGYFLAKAGKKVAIFERDRVGSGQSGRTTAHISNALDDRYQKLEKIHGEEGARIAAESHTAAINLVSYICEENKIDADFKHLPGYLLASSPSAVSFLEDEHAAANRAGIETRMVSTVPGIEAPIERALLFPDQGQFHILKYLDGLAIACQKNGAVIYTQSPVTDIEEGGTIKLSVNGCTVTAKDIVLATNSPVNRDVLVHSKQEPYRSYVVGLSVPKEKLPLALWWDTEDPYHYVRLFSSKEAAEDILIVGGEDHRTGEEPRAEERYTALEKWSHKHFAGLGERLYQWSGQVMEPVDGPALIGRNPGSEHVYIITGDSGHGMTHGTLGGKLICDLVMERENPWSILYDPSRFRTRSIPELTRAGASMMKNYAEWIVPEKKSLDEIGPNEGAVVQEGARKVAAYREADGKLTKRSAACGHMGCAVAWNADEKTFDCACHGSWFDRYGKALNGPTLKDLTPLD